MAAIECKLCNSDTGYTDDTPISDRNRSIAIGQGDTVPKGDVCFCTSCWVDKGIGSTIENLRTS